MGFFFLQNLTRKPFSIWASTMLTQIGKTFFFVWESIIIFNIPLLFFVELTAVTMQCNSCPLLDQWLYQRKCCVQLVPLSKGKHWWQRSLKKPWDKFSFTKLYYHSFHQVYLSADHPHHSQWVWPSCKINFDNSPLSLGHSRLCFQILPFLGSFSTCSLILGLKGDLLPTAV